jgi:hypothetical protein
VPAVGDRGDRREIDLARDEALVELGRNAADLLDPASSSKKTGAMFT